jgi:hypothetical protein
VVRRAADENLGHGAADGYHVYGDTIPAHASDKRIVVTKEPVGV